MPERCVTMWKLIARKPRRTAKLAALATNTPTARISSPASSRGRKAPICSHSVRKGSSRTST